MLAKIDESQYLQALQHALQSGDSILIENLWNAPKALIASFMQKVTGKHVLILTGASQEESRLYHEFAYFTDRPVLDFPAWETLPSENIAPSPDIVGERYKVLHRIISDSQPYFVLTSLQACLQKLIPPKHFSDLYFELVLHQTCSFEDIQKKLQGMGYQKQSIVSDKGEFALRGGIIDIFPVSSPDPYRIEFWGDEIESIRTFDPVGQKSVSQVQQVKITPAKELELLGEQKQLGSILDYLGPNTIVIFDDILALEDRYASLVSMSSTPSRSFSSIEAFLDQLAPLQKVYWPQQPVEELSEIRVLERLQGSFYSEKAPLYLLSFQLFNREFTCRRWQHPFLTISNYLLPQTPENENISGNEILLALSKLSNTNAELHLLCPSELEESTLKKRLLDAQIHLPSHTSFEVGYLSSGFVFPEENQILLPMAEITHRYKIRRQKQRSTYHTTPSEIYDLTPGDLVVHLNSGIGKFIGLEKRPNHQGILSEFFTIEYAENAKLYVPLNQAHLISKYIGAHDEIPKMHTLGSARWKKTRELTERAIMGYAAELLEMYAKRSMKGGMAYPKDSADMQAFEEDFPFVETEDQLSAIAELKEDMVSSKAMDRLVCGDVGYGKTEVAMRAAFKAVVDGHKQVAVLVPTTVLAMQHYENFIERMSNFPVNIGVLSRFRTPKQIRETLEGVAKGSVDILIGTHRIISGDVIFNDLGLVIIDEEQRFGVKAKEHLKKIKVAVDCLTLSATPIPRTLYMSLVGARDMSVISTPPQDRLPISTFIAEPTDLTLKNALLRELSRDGQAYVIHNRVETIYDTSSRIKKLLPQARVVVVHGQMDSDEIDSVFHAFKSGQADILVATTIVENGIDIPNANTILIERADRFGLADLYQLRGRVGRWNRRAYAYFLVSNQRALPEIARKRLSALMESSGYGGGMKIAMRDLEIRGAGDILGLEQSGHVSAIGFHLYCKLLKRTIHALQGKIPGVITDTKIEFPFDARLPETYVESVSLRMEIYQRLGGALSLEDVDLIGEELRDRFGPPPEEVRWLIHLARIRVHAGLNGFTLLKLDKVTLLMERNKGKNISNKRVIIGKIKNAQDFESRVIKAMKEF